MIGENDSNTTANSVRINKAFVDMSQKTSFTAGAGGASTITPNMENATVYQITKAAGSITINNPTNATNDGTILRFVLANTDASTSTTLTWGSEFGMGNVSGDQSIDVPTTVSSAVVGLATHYVIEFQLMEALASNLGTGKKWQPVLVGRGNIQV